MVPTDPPPSAAPTLATPAETDRSSPSRAVGVDQLIHPRPTDTEHVCGLPNGQQQLSPSDRLQLLPMLQLATLSARGASEVPDLLITPGSRAAPARASTLHRICFGPAWRSPLQFAISTIGNSAGLISAGYMIVNGLAPTPSGLWSERPSRQPCGADPSSSRNPTRARGISSRRDCAEKESTVTPRHLRSTRSLAMGKIIAVAAGKDLMAL
jgi:hypothetical protein